MKISRNAKILLIFFIFLSVIILSGFFGCTESATAKNTGVSEKYANDFTLPDLEGKEISMHDYKGKIVVLNFWATWCPPCQAEIPDFVEVSDAYMEKGVQFFGISDDFINSLKAFVVQYKINYPILLVDNKDNIYAEWQIKSIPHTFILDRNGNIVFDQLGRISRDQLVDAIETATQEKQ